MKLPLAISLVFTTLTTVSLARGISSPDKNAEIDLVAMLQEPLAPRGEVFSQAIKVISSYQTAPSCHRLASANLLSSCKQLDAHEHQDPTWTLDLIKATFAARLAICELTEAHAAIPPQCLPMVPTKRTEDGNFKCLFPGSRCQSQSERAFAQSHGFLSVSEKQISQCTGALESRPQWWTSYSNARQNAYAMCHAMRSEVERAELLELHKAMAELDDDAARILAQQIQDAERHLAQSKEFAEAVHELQDRTRREMESSHSMVHSMIDSIKRRVEANAINFFDMFSSRTEAAVAKLDKLGSTIDHSIQAAEQGANRVQSILRDMADDASLASTAQDSVMQSSRKAASEVLSRVEVVRDAAVPELVAQLVSLQSQMRANAEYMHLIHQSHSSLDSRVASLDKKFAAIQSATTGVEKALHSNVVSQQRAFEAFEAGMIHVHDRLNETVDDVIGRVHSAAREAVADVRALGHGLLGNLGMWKQAVFVGALACYDVKAAALAVVFSVCLSASHYLGPISTSLTEIGRIVSLPPLPVLIAAATIAVLVGAIYLVRSCRQPRQASRVHEEDGAGREKETRAGL